MIKFYKILAVVIIAFLGAIAVFGLVFIILTAVISPRDSESHPIMPIFQYLMSWFFGIVSFCVLALVGYKKFVKN